MVRGWSWKKLFCELFLRLRLFEISILFGLILGSVYCAVFWLLGVSVCTSKWEVGCSNQRRFHPGAAVLSLALMVAQCSAAMHPLGVLWLPSRRWHQHNPLPGSSEGNAVPGWTHTACRLIPEMQGNGNRHWSAHHRSVCCISVDPQLLRQGHLVLLGKRTQPQQVMLLLHQNMQLSLLGTCKTCWRKLWSAVGWAGGNAGCTDESQLALCPVFQSISLFRVHPPDKTAANMEPLRRSSSPDLGLFFTKLFAAVTVSHYGSS